MMAEELYLLRDLIHDRTGLFFRDDWGIDTIATRLQPLAEGAGCNSLSEYYSLLGAEKDEGVWHGVITAFSKPATSFIRHLSRSLMLAEDLMPPLVERGKPIRIWSACCSSGEEPLMAAIALDEAGWFEGADIEIVASDANTEALEKARAGIYHNVRIETLPHHIQEKYFSKVENGWQISPEIHSRVRWAHANLANEAEIAGFADADVIFCRNVFIYFSDETIVRTLRIIAKYMRPGGYLISDEGEHFTELVRKAGGFQQETINDIPVWVKG